MASRSASAWSPSSVAAHRAKSFGQASPCTGRRSIVPAVWVNSISSETWPIPSSSARVSQASGPTSSRTARQPWNTNGMSVIGLHFLDWEDKHAMNVLMLSREYPPHIYGGAGVVVDELSRAMARLARVEVRCFGDQQAPGPALGVRGYAPPAEIARAAAAFRHRPVLEALAVDLAMAAESVEADIVHSHTWYVAFGGVLVRALFDIPLVVTLHSLEPLRPWKEHQLGTGYRVSTWLERLAVEQAERVIAVSEQMRAD